jgi:hypothetical protein
MVVEGGNKIWEHPWSLLFLIGGNKIWEHPVCHFLLYCPSHFCPFWSLVGHKSQAQKIPKNPDVQTREGLTEFYSPKQERRRTLPEWRTLFRQQRPTVEIEKLSPALFILFAACFGLLQFLFGVGFSLKVICDNALLLFSYRLLILTI